MLCFADVLLKFLFPLTPVAFAGSQLPGKSKSTSWRVTRDKGRWFKGSPISPSVRRPPAAPSVSNSAPSFEPDTEDEDEPIEDP